MTERLPLFPLGSVLFPGLVLPLHVFEERYRQLVRDLLALPDGDRRFGVVAIRSGREVGADGVAALHAVGCTAAVRRVDPHDDGRYDVVTVGVDRFRLVGLVDDGAPYLVGEVEDLPDSLGDGAAAAEGPLLGRAVAAAFVGYLTALSEAGGGHVEPPDLPESPLVLSHLVAATTALDLAERQALLEQPDGVARLRAELSLLRRETTLLQVLSAAPSPELARGPASPN